MSRKQQFATDGYRPEGAESFPPDGEKSEASANQIDLGVPNEGC